MAGNKKKKQESGRGVPTRKSQTTTNNHLNQGTPQEKTQSSKQKAKDEKTAKQQGDLQKSAQNTTNKKGAKEPDSPKVIRTKTTKAAASIQQNSNNSGLNLDSNLSQGAKKQLMGGTGPVCGILSQLQAAQNQNLQPKSTKATRQTHEGANCAQNLNTRTNSAGINGGKNRRQNYQKDPQNSQQHINQKQQNKQTSTMLQEKHIGEIGAGERRSLGAEMQANYISKQSAQNFRPLSSQGITGGGHQQQLAVVHQSSQQKFGQPLQNGAFISHSKHLSVAMAHTKSNNQHHDEQGVPIKDFNLEQPAIIKQSTVDRAGGGNFQGQALPTASTGRYQQQNSNLSSGSTPLNNIPPPAPASVASQNGRKQANFQIRQSGRRATHFALTGSATLQGFGTSASKVITAAQPNQNGQPMTMVQQRVSSGVRRVGAPNAGKPPHAGVMLTTPNQQQQAPQSNAMSNQQANNACQKQEQHLSDSRQNHFSSSRTQHCEEESKNYQNSLIQQQDQKQVKRVAYSRQKSGANGGVQESKNSLASSSLQQQQMQAVENYQQMQNQNYELAAQQALARASDLGGLGLGLGLGLGNRVTTEQQIKQIQKQLHINEQSSGQYAFGSSQQKVHSNQPKIELSGENYPFQMSQQIQVVDQPSSSHQVSGQSGGNSAFFDKRSRQLNKGFSEVVNTHDSLFPHSNSSFSKRQSHLSDSHPIQQPVQNSQQHPNVNANANVRLSRRPPSGKQSSQQQQLMIPIDSLAGKQILKQAGILSSSSTAVDHHSSTNNKKSKSNQNSPVIYLVRDQNQLNQALALQHQQQQYHGNKQHPPHMFVRTKSGSLVPIPTPTMSTVSQNNSAVTDSEFFQQSNYIYHENSSKNTSHNFQQIGGAVDSVKLHRMKTVVLETPPSAASASNTAKMSKRHAEKASSAQHRSLTRSKKFNASSDHHNQHQSKRISQSPSQRQAHSSKNTCNNNTNQILSQGSGTSGQLQIFRQTSSSEHQTANQTTSTTAPSSSLIGHHHKASNSIGASRLLMLSSTPSIYKRTKRHTFGRRMTHMDRPLVIVTFQGVLGDFAGCVPSQSKELKEVFQTQLFTAYLKKQNIKNQSTTAGNQDGNQDKNSKNLSICTKIDDFSGLLSPAELRRMQNLQIRSGSFEGLKYLSQHFQVVVFSRETVEDSWFSGKGSGQVPEFGAQTKTLKTLFRLYEQHQDLHLDGLYSSTTPAKLQSLCDDYSQIFVDFGLNGSQTKIRDRVIFINSIDNDFVSGQLVSTINTSSAASQNHQQQDTISRVHNASPRGGIAGNQAGQSQQRVIEDKTGQQKVSQTTTTSGGVSTNQPAQSEPNEKIEKLTKEQMRAEEKALYCARVQIPTNQPQLVQAPQVDSQGFFMFDMACQPPIPLVRGVPITIDSTKQVAQQQSQTSKCGHLSKTVSNSQNSTTKECLVSNFDSQLQSKENVQQKVSQMRECQQNEMPISLLVPNVRNMTLKTGTSFWLVVKSLMLLTLLAQKGNNLVKHVNQPNQSEIVMQNLDYLGQQIKDRMVKIVGSQLRITSDSKTADSFGTDGKKSIFGHNNQKSKGQRADKRLTAITNSVGEDSPYSQNSSTNNESFSNTMFNSRKTSQNNLQRNANACDCQCTCKFGQITPIQNQSQQNYFKGSSQMMITTQTTSTTSTTQSCSKCGNDFTIPSTSSQKVNSSLAQQDEELERKCLVHGMGVNKQQVQQQSGFTSGAFGEMTDSETLVFDFRDPQIFTNVAWPAAVDLMLNRKGKDQRKLLKMRACKSDLAWRFYKKGALERIQLRKMREEKIKKMEQLVNTVLSHGTVIANQKKSLDQVFQIFRGKDCDFIHGSMGQRNYAFFEKIRGRQRQEFVKEIAKHRPNHLNKLQETKDKKEDQTTQVLDYQTQKQKQQPIDAKQANNKENLVESSKQQSTSSVTQNQREGETEATMAKPFRESSSPNEANPTLIKSKNADRSDQKTLTSASTNTLEKQIKQVNNPLHSGDETKIVNENKELMITTEGEGGRVGGKEGKQLTDIYAAFEELLERNQLVNRFVIVGL